MLVSKACTAQHRCNLSEFALGAEVRRLVATHLASMDHLEVLLLLSREKAGSMTVDEIASRLKRPFELVEKAVVDLESGGLVSATANASGHSAFAYSPRSPELTSATDELAAMYNERPVTLVRAIYDRPAAPVMSFADAFRIREGGK